MAFETLSRQVAYRYPYSLIQGSLIQRYKRFLADIDFISSSNVETKSSINSDIKTVYCPNTGSMYGLLPTSSTVPRLCACSVAPVGTIRKYDNTLEMILDNNVWVGIHSSLANNIVKNCLKQGWITEYTGFDILNSEVTVKENCKLDFELLWTDNSNTITHNGTSNTNNSHNEIMSVIESKINSGIHEDIITQSKGKRKTNTSLNPSSKRKKSILVPSLSSGGTISRRVLLEVKSVTLSVLQPYLPSNPSSTSSSSIDINSIDSIIGSNDMTPQVQVYSAQFPDCVSTRAQKHCQYLSDHVSQSGGEAAILFLIQRDDCSTFSASSFDPTYGKLLSRASQVGVKILPYVCKLDPTDGTIELIRKVPFVDTYLDMSLS